MAPETAAESAGQREAPAWSAWGPKKGLVLMALTLEELQAQQDELKKVLASGATRVTTDGKTVYYGDATDLLKRLAAIESEIAGLSTPPPRVAGFATFRRC